MRDDLLLKVSQLADVLTVRLPRKIGDHPAGRILREIFATRSAHEVISCVAMLFPSEIQSSISNTGQGGGCEPQERSLPSADTIRSGTPSLLAAVTDDDALRTADILREMGLLSLSLPSALMLERLELCTTSLSERARLICLIELALFASELDMYERAAGYASEAHALSPGPSELHDLHTVSGILALVDGKKDKARGQLAKSIRTCRVSEYARRNCAVRPPNLMLAKRLVEQGEIEPVVEYLAECEKVWLHYAEPIASLSHALRSGQKPEVVWANVMARLDRPAARLMVSTIKALGARPGSDVDMDEFWAEQRRRAQAAIKGKLNTGKS